MCRTLRLSGHARRCNKPNALDLSTIEAVHPSRLTDKFWKLVTA